MVGETVTSVRRAVQIVRLVSEVGPDGLGVSEIARRTGLAKSTVFRLLATLEETRAMERADEGYRLGDLFTPGRLIPTVPAVERVQVVVTPFLSALYEATRHTCQLAVLDGRDVVFLNKLHGIHRVPSPSRIGGRIPAHCTSLGKVLLAFDRPAADVVCGGPLTALTRRTITDPDALRVELARAARTRIGQDDEETVDGVGSLASVVTDADGRPAAAMCVSGPREVVLGAGYERVVRDVCLRASRALARVGDADPSALVGVPVAPADS